MNSILGCSFGMEKQLAKTNTNPTFKNKSPHKNDEDDNSLYEFPTKALMYSNNIAESIRPIIDSKAANIAWFPTLLYGGLTVHDKYQKSKPQDRKKNVGREVIYQVFGSFMVPPITAWITKKILHPIIDKIPDSTKKFIKNKTKNVDWMQRVTSKYSHRSTSSYVSGHRNIILSAVTLFTIFATAKPVDVWVNKVLDRIFNKK